LTVVRRESSPIDSAADERGGNERMEKFLLIL
jgi:hypothetical protein